MVDKRVVSEETPRDTSKEVIGIPIGIRFEFVTKGGE